MYQVLITVPPKKKESSSLHSTVLRLTKALIITQIFSRKLLQSYVVHDFMLLLTPFKSKLTNYAMRTDRLNVR